MTPRIASRRFSSVAHTWQVVSARNVALYVVGNTLSNFGGWTYNVAAAILVYRLTESTFLVGAVTFAQFIGAVLFAPWAGSAADRFDRRKLLMFLQLGASICALILAITTALGYVSAALVIGMTALLGFTVAFSTPAMQALIPLLVHPRDLDVAVALSSATFNIARAVGPLIAAAVITWWGVAVAIGINAVSFLFFVMALAIIRPRHVTLTPTRGRGTFRASVVSAWDHRNIRMLLIAVAAVSFATDPITTLAPEYATVVFGLSDTMAGYIMGAFGVGATVSALLLTLIFRRMRHGLAIAMTIQAVGIIGFALAPNLPLAIVAVFTSGIGFIGASTRASVTLQSLVPEHSLGRLMALWSVAFLGTRPFAALIDGVLAEVVGPRIAAASMVVPVALRAVATYMGQ
ncbi:MAG: MFS transporter, partial [Ilumatobacteraceae bacterium]